MKSRPFFFGRYLLPTAALISISGSVAISLAGNIWDGGGADDNWGTPENWTPDGTPSPGIASDLIFAGTTRLSPINNYGDGNDFRDITYDLSAGAFTISNTGTNGIDWFGIINNNSASTQTLGFRFYQSASNMVNATAGNVTLNSAALLFRNGQALTLNAAAGKAITMNNVIDNGGGGAGSAISINGAGLVTLAGANTFTSGVAVTAGTLSIASDNNLGASVGGVSLNGGTLRTTNSGGFLINTHAVTIGASGGTLSITGTGAGQGGLVRFGTANTLLGSGGLTVSGNGLLDSTGGSGALVLGASNTYSGNISLLNGGLVEYGATGAVGAAATFSLGNNGGLAVNSGLTMTNATTVTGTGSVLSFNNGNTGIISGTIALNAGTDLTVGLRDWYNLSQARNGTISGLISGSGGLNINSGTSVTPGTLTITGANAGYSGNISLTNAKIFVGNGTNTTSQTATLGTGILTMNNGTTFRMNTGSSGSIFLSNAIAIASGATANVESGSASSGYAGLISGGSTSTLAIVGGTQVSFNATNTAQFANLLGTVLIDTGGSFRFSTSSTLNNGGVNTTFDLRGTGALTTRGGGTVNLGSLTGTAGAVTGASGAAGTVTYVVGAKNQASTYAGTIANGNFSVAGSQTVILQKNGTESLTLTNTNTYTGGTNVIAGSIGIGNNSALGNGTLNLGGTNANTPTIFASGGARSISNNVTFLATSGGGNPTITGSENLTITGVVTASGAERTFTVNNSGATTLSGNVFLSNDNTSASRGLIVNGTGNTTISGVIANNNSGNTLAATLTKTGAGTLTLTNASIYTGATQVNAGKLLVGDGISGSLGNTVVIVGGSTGTGTPTLGGRGTIGGATTISAANGGAAGTHAPGISGMNNGVGQQTFSSTLNYASSSIFEWDLQAASASDPGVVSNAATGTYDSVVANGGSGSVTGGSSVFKVVLGGNTFADAFWNTDKSWTNIFMGSGTPALLGTLFGSFSPTGGLASDGTVLGEGQFTFNGSTSTLNWSAVPEPSSLLTGLLLAGGLLRRRRA